MIPHRRSLLPLLLLTAAVATAAEEIPLDTFPMASLASPDGKHVLILHAGTQPPSIRVLDAGTLQEVSRTPVPDAWLGFALSRDGKFVYVGGGARAAVFEFSFAGGKLSPTRTFEAAAAASRTPDDFVGDVQLSPDGRLLYAADLFHNNILVINPQSGRVIERFPTGRRPYRIVFHPDGKSFFVSSWADGGVYHHRATDGERLGAIRLGPHTTDMVLSSKPVIATEDEEKPIWKHRLFVAASNTNQVFAVGITETQEMRLVESISVAVEANTQPAGMTPSALALNQEEKELYVVCSDLNSAAVVNIESTKSQLLGFATAGVYPLAARHLPGNRLLVLNARPGSASVIDLTRDVAPLRLPRGAEGVPAGLEGIAHVVYVVIDKSGASFNKVANEFVTLEKYRSVGTGEASILHWAIAGISPDYVEKMSPSSAAGRRLRKDLEGGEPAALPPAGYLWTNAISAGLTLRNHGFWFENQKVKDPGLARFTNLNYPAVLEDLKANPMPALTLIRLKQDSELGPIMDGLRASPNWARTAVFAVSLDGRATLASPFAKHGFRDATPYTQNSVLRTIELLLKLQPMTTFDALARPLWNAFGKP